MSNKHSIIDISKAETSVGNQTGISEQRAGNPFKLTFDNVSFGYGNKKLISGLNIGLKHEELTVISGPNGSGKTTLLYLACRIEKPVEGRISIDGRNISEYNRRELSREISLMPQYLPYTPWLTVREIVELGTYTYKSIHMSIRNDRSEIQVTDSRNEQVQAAMNRAGISHLAYRFSGELSGGELRRVHLARVLAQDARIVLFDEPTSDLDMHHIGALVTLIKFLKDEGLTVVVVTHDLNFATVLNGRLILMKDGAVIADDAPCRLMNYETLSKVYPGGFRIESLSDGEVAVMPTHLDYATQNGMGKRGGNNH